MRRALISPLIGAANGCGRRAGAQGYALIELILALLVVSLLAGLALPWARRGSGASEMQALALRIVTLLRNDRNVALREGRTVVSRLDALGGSVRSGNTDAAIVLPAHSVLRTSDSLTRGVKFDPDGRAEGGEIVLVGPGTGEIILRIDAVSAAIQVSEGKGRHAR